MINYKMNNRLFIISTIIHKIKILLLYNLQMQNRLTRQQSLQRLNRQLDYQPLSYSILYYLQKIIKALRLPCSRSEDCSHRGSCLASLIFSSVKTGFMAYGIKFLLTFVFSLRKLFTSKTTIWKLLGNKTTINFGLFLGSFVAILRLLVCSLRRKCGKTYQKYLFMLGGLIGGILSSFFLQKSSRQALGLFMMARALDSTYRSLVKKKYLPEFKYFYILMYSISMVVTGYCFVNEPGSLSKQTHNFYKNFTYQDIAQMQMRQITIQRQNIKLAQKGISPQDPLQLMPRLKVYYSKQESE